MQENTTTATTGKDKATVNTLAVMTACSIFGITDTKRVTKAVNSFLARGYVTSKDIAVNPADITLDGNHKINPKTSPTAYILKAGTAGKLFGYALLTARHCQDLTKADWSNSSKIIGAVRKGLQGEAVWPTKPGLDKPMGEKEARDFEIGQLFNAYQATLRKRMKADSDKTADVDQLKRLMSTVRSVAKNVTPEVWVDCCAFMVLASKTAQDAVNELE